MKTMEVNNKLLFISILSTIFTAQWISAQGFNEAGYDLHKGPIFYEAYYYPEKQNLHTRRSIEEKEENVAEKISQTSNNPNVMISINGDEVIVIGEKLTRVPIPSLGVRNGFTNWFDEQRRLFQTYPRKVHENRLKEIKINTEDNRSNVMNEGLKNDRDKFSATSRFQRTANPSYRRNVDSDFVSSQNKLPLNVKFNDDSISNQRPTNFNSRTQNFDSYNSRNQNFGFDNHKNQNFGFDSRNNQNYEEGNRNNKNTEIYIRENENLSNERPGMGNFESESVRVFPETLQENIFEPRPQIIKYLFSAPRENSFAAKKSNFINDDAQIDAVIKEPGIASIEVSEEPRHKIRHHHGERLRRNYSRQ